MRRPDSVTTTIWLAVVVAMVLGFSLQREVTTVLPYFGFERRQELPKVEERFLLQLPGRVAALLDILDRYAGRGQTDRPRHRPASASPPSLARRARAESGQSRRAGRGGDAPSHRSGSERAATGDRRRSLSSRRRESRAGGRTRRERYLDRSFPLERAMASRRDQPGPAASERPSGGRVLSRQRCVAWVVLSLALAALLSVVAARRVVKPLSELSAAVDRLGPSGDDPSVPPHGPREIEGIIRAFNRMRERLRRFNEDRTRMMAAMSHDLRTPLTRLRMRIEMAQGLEDQQKMLDELDMMNGMVESILSFTRDDSKQEARSLVDLSALVEGICEDAVDAGEKVTFSGPRDVTISCRPTAMRRAISNLVDNAVKYGGKADVTLAPEAGRVVITVEDEGPGIPRSEREKVFEPFYRIGSARDPSTGGVGLGLSVTRSIVWEHGGDITLGNRKGGGLSVRVELPLGPGLTSLNP